jgi:hypothetical protein
MAMVAPVGAAALESSDCLACHSEADAVGTNMLIDPARYDHTAHGELGCLTCHESVTDQHPDDGLAPSKAVCRDCHQDIGAEYARTEHAGNATCGDCHNPHTVRSFQEVSGVDMNRQCANCHEATDMAAAHGVWLPQADLHLEMLPCISCHSGSENYVIALYISRRDVDPRYGTPVRSRPFDLAGFDELAELAGVRGVQGLIDTDGDGTVTLAELRSFNTSPVYRSLRLKGMLTPEVVTHELRILDNRWDCTFCHGSGPGTMQTSVLAFPQEDGSYTRLPVEKGAVLDALYGTPDFYMMGATRNASMNILGLIIIAGGLVMPVGHGLLRFLTRKNRL